MAFELKTTPRGVAVFPRLTRPDTKFDAGGVYTVKLRLPVAEAEGFMNTIDQWIDEALVGAKADNPKKKTIKRADPPYKEDEENEGYILFNFKMKAKGKNRKGEVYTQKPAIYDAKGKSVTEAGLNIGGGSEVKVSFFESPFYTAAVGAGVSLRLKGVQILKLVEFGERSAASMGFEAEDDGFTYEANDTAPQTDDLTDADAPSAPADPNNIPDF